MNITLQNVKRKFEQWRAAKKNPKEKIPNELLKLACACGFKYGKGVTLIALNLNTKNLRYAMDTYSNIIPKNEIKKSNEKIIEPKIEFFEVKVKQNETKIETPSLNRAAQEVNQKPLIYELKNKFGVKVRVFTESVVLQQNIFSAFLLGCELCCKFPIQVIFIFLKTALISVVELNH